MLQILISLAIYMVLVIPMGTYMYHIATNKKTFADPVFNRIDNGIYKLCRINRQGMNWKQYALHLLMANAVMEFFSTTPTESKEWNQPFLLIQSSAL